MELQWNSSQEGKLANKIKKQCNKMASEGFAATVEEHKVKQKKNVCELTIKTFKLKTYGQEESPWPCIVVRFWENLVVGIMETRNQSACMRRTERSVYFLSQEIVFKFPEAPSHSLVIQAQK